MPAGTCPDPLPFDRNLRRAFRSAAQQDGDPLSWTRARSSSRVCRWRATASRGCRWRALDLPANLRQAALIGYRIESPRTTPGGALDLTTFLAVTGDLGIRSRSLHTS